MAKFDIDEMFAKENKEKYEEEIGISLEKSRRCQELLNSTFPYNADDRLGLEKAVEIFTDSADRNFHKSQCCDFHSCNHVWGRIKAIELESRDYVCMKCGLKPFSYVSTGDTEGKEQQTGQTSSKFYMDCCGFETEQQITEFVSKYPLRAEKRMTVKAIDKIYNAIISEKPDISDEELLEEFNKKSNDPAFYQEKVVRRRDRKSW